jgi:membrane protein
MGAAIAFYTVFSLAPVLLTVIAVAGLVFGRETAQGAIVAGIGGLIGHDGAAAIEAMVASASDAESGVIGRYRPRHLPAPRDWHLCRAAGFVEHHLEGEAAGHWGAAFIRSRLLSLTLAISGGVASHLYEAVDEGLG